MKTIIFSDNSKAEVIEETGKYYITKKTQYRKSNPAIAEVVNEEEKPKAKKSSSKKATVAEEKGE